MLWSPRALLFTLVPPGAEAAGTRRVKYPRRMIQHQHLLLGVFSGGSKLVPPAQPARCRRPLVRSQAPRSDTGHLLTAQFKTYLMESNTN